jgi:hypothetical protein
MYLSSSAFGAISTSTLKATYSDTDGWIVKDQEVHEGSIGKYILDPDNSSKGWQDTWFSLDANTHTEEECEEYRLEVIDIIENEFMMFCFDCLESANSVLADAFKPYKDEPIRSESFNLEAILA